MKQMSNGAVDYFHPDHLGSTSVVTTATGTQEQSLAYYPFGGTRANTGTLNVPYKYTDKELDETGLYFYGARYYDATLGRFVSADSIIPDPTNPQDLNRYSYVRNNPLRYIDETGHGPNVCSSPDCDTDACCWGIEFLGWLFGSSDPSAGSPSSPITPSSASGLVSSTDPIRVREIGVMPDFEFPYGPAGVQPGGAAGPPSLGSSHELGARVGEIASFVNPVFAFARSIAGLVVGTDPFSGDPFSPLEFAIGVGTIGKVPPGAKQALGKITGFRKHGIDQAISRGIGPSDILDAVRNPLRNPLTVVDPRGRMSTEYIGKGATVYLNPVGEVITVHGTHSKLVERLLRGK
jgi:RHS repeat-associated protein